MSPCAAGRCGEMSHRETALKLGHYREHLYGPPRLDPVQHRHVRLIEGIASPIAAAWAVSNLLCLSRRAQFNGVCPDRSHWAPTSRLFESIGSSIGIENGYLPGSSAESPGPRRQPTRVRVELQRN